MHDLLSHLPNIPQQTFPSALTNRERRSSPLGASRANLI
jgi:hypothetical protein